MAELAALPPELVSNIFEFVRSQNDRKSVCLTTRMLRNLMLPIIWSCFETDLTGDAELFNVLVDSKSDIVAHIKHFVLAKPAKSTRITDLQRERLQSLFAALPRDNLLSFEAKTTIDSDTFRIVVQSQRQLQDLDLTLYEGLSDEVDWSPYVAAVTDLSLSIACEATEAARTFSNYWTLIQQTPKLESISIYSTYNIGTFDAAKRYTDISLLEFPKAKGDSGKFSLEQLTLMHLEVGFHHHRITSHINLGTLLQFELIDCLDPQPILRVLAKAYSGGPCVLANLTICLSRHAVARADGLGFCQDIEGLLLSFSGVESLFLSLLGFGLVTKESILHHAQSLKTCAIAVDRASPITYKASDMTSILKACIKLDQLAVPLGLGTTSWERLCQDIVNRNVGSTDGSQVNEIHATLTAIASHPRLHTLRITDPAFIDWDADNTAHQWESKTLLEKYVEVAAVSLQNLATNILRFLCERGSGIRALAWIPHWSEAWPESPKDSNGQRWRSYVYCRGRVIDAQGMGRIVAVPVKNFSVELEESWIFSEP